MITVITVAFANSTWNKYMLSVLASVDVEMMHEMTCDYIDYTLHICAECKKPIYTVTARL